MNRAPSGRRSRLLTAGLALVLLPVGQQAQAADDPAPSLRTRAGQTALAAHTVTLITGDKVTVTDIGGGRKTVDVERAKGAQGKVLTQTDHDGDITVVPDEARAFLAAGKLDKRLFDVSELIRQGYAAKAGQQAEGLPLIVTYGKGARAVTPQGADRTRALPSINGAAVEAERSGEMWQALTDDGARTRSFGSGIQKIWLDGKVKADMAESNAQIGSAKAWEAGLTGKGVKVAVLDTGADLTHPDLKDRITETKSFIAGEEVADRNGHGTHVASTVGGSGAASDGKEQGVAPGAELAVGKVLSDGGSGSDSEIIAGMEWAAKDIDAKVISMSLGTQEPGDGTDPMSQAVNNLTEETGALFVIAAGNSGYSGSIGSPGAADSALTIGAVDSTDTAAGFTSKGPRMGDNALKPDLSAPGVDILAARSSLIEGEGSYMSISGTSMATPHVAGVAALLAEKHPDWTPRQLKDALMSTSKTLTDSPYDLGAGRVSVPDAVEAQVTATGSADFGFYSWPYEDNQPVTKTLTYTNHTDQPVELTLAAAGADYLTFADSTLTVPANGTASTTVTADGAKAPVGNNGGHITATSGDRTVAHTAWGLAKEEERYTLTVHVKDRDGSPIPGSFSLLKLAAGEEGWGYEVGESGTVKLRLQPGTYALDGLADVKGTKGKDSLGIGYFSEPEITLDRDREITLDGRKLREIDAEVDKRTETRQLIMQFSRTANGTGIANKVQVPLTYDSIFAAPSEKPATGTYEYRTVWRLGKPMLSVEAGGRRIGEATVQGGGTILDGDLKLPVVDAGDGSAAAYAGKDVKGKAVVVRATGNLSAVEIGQNAQDAGAKALFVGDEAAGRLMDWWGTDAYEDRPLHIATVNSADAARLVEAARRGQALELEGTQYTPYVYDLTDGHSGAIPDRDLTFEPSRRELAVIDTKFHAAKRTDGGEFRYSMTSAYPIGVGFYERIDFPRERTDYVSTGEGQEWHESVKAGPEMLEQRSGEFAYEGGSRQELNWFKPVLHPWLGTGLGWGQGRYGNNVEFNVPGWGDSGPDHTGFGDVWSAESGLTQQTKVYVDGKLVDDRTGSGAYAWSEDVESKVQDFKVVTDTTADPAKWHLSTRGHSEWTVKSGPTPEDRYTYLPMLNLGFDVDTDLAGNVRGGGLVPVGIFAEYIKGAVDTGRIGKGSLEVSYDDGKSWKTVKLSDGAGASWKTLLAVPRDAAFVSLRASVVDDRGGSVKQEIIRAFGVK
ncbi:S8 family serine peptidase [Streptomyces sp. TRM66268-LWL]|uniref:S8 family serine peptidase n=1 Tax=Streptomyces polyasparticus TaxID=2767826 RepID=A0ABR7SE82_9ACTN|nr:S8 family serine peptidase [Streptomyces polyasparticus]MBC9712673.1 S8 family serine peptidase [Streptomyces polyasparticus]